MNPDRLVEILRKTTLALVRREGADLSIRQMAVFLSCAIDRETDHTVRGLAALLNVSKPAITRALDRLTELNLAERIVDRADRRSVIARLTGNGVSFFRDLTGTVDRAIQETRPAGAKAGEGAAVPAMELA